MFKVRLHSFSLISSSGLRERHIFSNAIPSHAHRLRLAALSRRLAGRNVVVYCIEVGNQRTRMLHFSKRSMLKESRTTHYRERNTTSLRGVVGRESCEGLTCGDRRTTICRLSSGLNPPDLAFCRLEACDFFSIPP